jgi:serpin B
MKKLLAMLMVTILMLGLAGCASTTSTSPTFPVHYTTPPTTPVGTPVEFTSAKSDLPRITDPFVSDAQLATLVADNSDFAFNLYQTLKKTNSGNMFYSPYSISSALAMTWSGAKTDTEKQMATALQFTLSQTQLPSAFNALSLQLASRGQNAKGTDGRSFSLNIANALWGQKDQTFLPAFLDILAVNYGAGMNLLDFMAAPDASRTTINKWVSDQTNAMIKDLLPPGSVTSSTRLVLTNAIYFDAAWQSPFKKDSTHDGTFNLLNGTTVTVPMMGQESGYSYVKADGYQAVEMPYDGNEVAMDIIMPDAGKFTSFEAGMTAKNVTAIIKSMNNTALVLNLPKFSFSSDFSLKDTLTSMGMPVAFTGKADFSGITGKQDLYISDVIHKAYVAVDEAGTKAAAATGVVMVGAAMPQNFMTIDQPFIFLIRDIQTGAILFVGRVMNPAQ